MRRDDDTCDAMAKCAHKQLIRMFVYANNSSRARQSLSINCCRVCVLLHIARRCCNDPLKPLRGRVRAPLGCTAPVCIYICPSTYSFTCACNPLARIDDLCLLSNMDYCGQMSASALTAPSHTRTPFEVRATCGGLCPWCSRVHSIRVIRGRAYLFAQFN